MSSSPPASSPVRSCVRLRPLSADERADGVGSAWVVNGGKRLGLRREVLEHEGRADYLADSEYAFDAVFGPSASTASSRWITLRT